MRDRSVNAFALPGGFVGTPGLIAMTASRDELASVLASNSRTSRNVIARRISGESTGDHIVHRRPAGHLAATKGNIQAANAGIMTDRAVAAQMSLNFSRHGARADRGLR